MGAKSRVVHQCSTWRFVRFAKRSDATWKGNPCLLRQQAYKRYTVLVCSRGAALLPHRPGHRISDHMDATFESSPPPYMTPSH